MGDQDRDEEIGWHRKFAVECNNQAWDLADQEQRTAEEERRMLYQAYSAAWHWSKIGRPVNRMRAEVTLAHVNSLAGRGPIAVQHALLAQQILDESGGEDWDAAFIRVELAYAAAVIGDETLFKLNYPLAKQLTEAVADPEDRAVVQLVLQKVPKAF